jgi:hypothetical protein
VHENLKWPDVFTQGNNLYLSDRESIFCGEKRFSLGYENYFIGDKYLLQYISAFDGRREARIIDTETEKIVKRAPDILGVTAIGDEIIMYCEGSIERFKYR